MNFFHEYTHILSDPAHLAVELTLMVLVDFLILGFIWPMVKRLVHREHLTIDAEHGVEHPSVNEAMAWTFR